MSDLRLETYTMPAGTIGALNPHPQMAARATNQPSAANVDPRIPAEDAARIGYGGRASCLPYLLQDDLGRRRSPRAFDVAVLENETLRATFLLELGGRLWSLFHKPSGRELLHVNPVFQPGNLAIRNAWFSGGVEWNFCWTGHTPFTCDPLFAARARLDDGTPVLRLYEYERGRGLPFQLDCYLPDGSPVLYVRVTLRNPDERTVPVYWWSNIAVPELSGQRILVPADSLYRFEYRTWRLGLIPHPHTDSTDRSRPANLARSCDNFYSIPESRQPWIATVDASGRGLFQTSTRELRGRKLFVWGQSPSGRRWQEFLNTPGHPYVEIQAGLERTQSSCRPLPGGCAFEWLEAYGLLTAEPAAAHGDDWAAACAHAEARIAAVAPLAALERDLARTSAMAQRAPERVLRRGSGWGALERRRRQLAGERPMAGPALPFGDETLGPEQAPWVDLLERGVFPEPDPAAPPASYQAEGDWHARLERALREARNDHWATWLQLGVVHLAESRPEAARQACETSLARRENVWALRNLARLAALDGRGAEALALYRRAAGLAPADWRLTIELCQCLIEGGQPRECLAAIDRAPDATRRRGRVRLLEARAAVAADELARFEAIVQDSFVLDDAREGEGDASEVWFSYKAKCLARELGQPLTDDLQARVRREFPPPRAFDYRMSGE